MRAKFSLEGGGGGLSSPCKQVATRLFVPTGLDAIPYVTKNCGMTCVTWRIRERVNFVSNLLAYLISVASQCIFSCLRLLL